MRRSGPASPPAVSKANGPKLAGLVAQLDQLDRLADLGNLYRLLEELEVTRDDLGPYAVFEPDRYQRNRISASDWYEFVCLCWLSGQRTPIHDHAGSSCAFRVIVGVATETRFERTSSGLVCPLWTRQHQPGYVCASEEADIHQVANTQPAGEELITLHIYSPQPQGFNVYSLDGPPPSADPESRSV